VYCAANTPTFGCYGPRGSVEAEALCLKVVGSRKGQINDFFFQFTLPGPLLRSSRHSSWLQAQRSQVRFPAIPNYLSSSGCGTGSTQLREAN
jgi:hypothetical protein